MTFDNGELVPTKRFDDTIPCDSCKTKKWEYLVIKGFYGIDDVTVLVCHCASGIQSYQYPYCPKYDNGFEPELKPYFWKEEK